MNPITQISVKQTLKFQLAVVSREWSLTLWSRMRSSSLNRPNWINSGIFAAWKTKYELNILEAKQNVKRHGSINCIFNNGILKIWYLIIQNASFPWMFRDDVRSYGHTVFIRDISVQEWRGYILSIHTRKGMCLYMPRAHAVVCGGCRPCHTQDRTDNDSSSK